jgi:Tol biopolymer transport system component
MSTPTLTALIPCSLTSSPAAALARLVPELLRPRLVQRDPSVQHRPSAFLPFWLAAVGALAPAAPALAQSIAVERVSLTAGNVQATGASSQAVLNGPGDIVVFASTASLVANDTNGVGDVYVRNRTSNSTERVSVRTDGSQGTLPSDYPSISADGRYVVFTSEASFTADDNNGLRDVFVRDRVAGTTIRASDGAAGAGSAVSPIAAISGDGRYVAYIRGGVMYRRDRVSGGTMVLSVGSPDITYVCESASKVAISRDGRYSACFAVGGSKSSKVLTVFEPGNPSPLNVTLYGNPNGNSFSLSADGRYIAYESGASHVAPDTNGLTDIYVTDLRTGTREWVSQGSGGVAGNQPSTSPSITADGRFVAFATRSSNLVAGDTNGSADILIRDRVLGTTARVSTSSAGGQGDGDSTQPSLSADGLTVAFESMSTNLVSGDTNGFKDVFVGRRGFEILGGNPLFPIYLSSLNATADEGSAVSPGFLDFRVNLSDPSTVDVDFQYWLEPVTALEGSDYKSPYTGRATIRAGSSSALIRVNLWGDSVREPNKTFNFNIGMARGALNGTPRAVGTIVNDDTTSFVGVFELTPVQAAVRAGEPVTYRFLWRVPTGGWRTLDTLELRFGEEGSLLWVRFEEATGLLRVYDPKRQAYGPGFLPGSANVLRSKHATVHLKESRLIAVAGSPSVSLELTVSFDPSAEGEEHPVELRGTNDAGFVQGFDHAGVITIIEPAEANRAGR